MSILGALLGTDASKAANNAAADTYAKQQAAVKQLTDYGSTLPAIYANAYAPYTGAGNDALSMLKAGLGLGGDTQAFTNAYQSLPGYQSALNTGTTAAQRLLNSGNVSQSGGALKALQRYGQDYEDQKSGDYLTRLAGLTNTGLAGTQGGLQGVGANTGIQQTAYGGNYGSAGTIGQGMVAGAQAQQDALGNLLKTGAYLGGAALGGPLGGGISSYLSGALPAKTQGNPWMGQQNWWQSGNQGPV